MSRCAECGRVEVRHRLLPARVVVDDVLGLALFSSTSSYEEVMRMLVAGHSWASGWSREWSVPTKAALFQARKRLGSVPLRALFDKAVVPLTDPQVAGGFYRSWRLMAWTGCAWTSPTPRPTWSGSAGRRPRAGWPWWRVSAGSAPGLAEWDRTRSSMPRSVPTGHGEQSLAEQVLRSLLPGMLLLADRGLRATTLWDKARGTGAGLLWRISPTLCCPSKV